VANSIARVLVVPASMTRIVSPAIASHRCPSEGWAQAVLVARHSVGIQSECIQKIKRIDIPLYTSYYLQMEVL
jgi:hypothetical protein